MKTGKGNFMSLKDGKIWKATMCVLGLPSHERRVYIGWDLKVAGHTYEYEFTVSGETKRESLMQLREILKADMKRYGAKHPNFPFLTEELAVISEYILDRPSCKVK